MEVAGAAGGSQHVQRLPVQLFIVAQIVAIVGISIFVLFARRAIDLCLDIIREEGRPFFLRNSTTSWTSSSETKAPWARTRREDFRGGEQHVAAADQGIGAFGVENGAGIDLRGHLEGDARGRFALITPVMTLTDGRWVAMIR
jgi:hypothetical protein